MDASPDTPTNGTGTPSSNRTFLDSEFRYSLFPWFYGIVCVVGLVANGYVLFVLRSLRQTKAMNEIRIYMTNLTVADLLFVCALPFWVDYYRRHGDWVSSDLLCRVTGSLFFINTYCSVLFLGAISVNRYWAVTRPLQAASSNHWWRGAAVSMAIWAVTLAMAVPYLLKPGVQMDERGVSRCFEGYHHDEDAGKRWVAATHFVIVGAFFLVFLLVAVCNLLIARTLLARGPDHVSAMGAGTPKSGPTQGVKRTALQMLCAVVGVFVVCFLPHHLVQGPWTLAVLEIREGWGSTAWGAETRQGLNDLHQVTLMLMGLNCLLDPVVYFFATRKFRRYIRGQLKRIGRGEGCSYTTTTHLSMESRNQSHHLHSLNRRP